MRAFFHSGIAALSLAVLAPSLVFAQNRATPSPLHFNNPLNQAGMYNNSPALHFNNPMNQAGMYNNSPALYYNNPLNQANMYNNSAALYYNNPLNQANMYNNSAALYYNNPLNQANMYNNSAALNYNNPLNQTGLYNGRPGLMYNNPLNQAGMYNGAGGLFYNNPTNQNSLITGYVPGTTGLGNQAVPGAIAGRAGGNNLNMQANQGAGRNQFGTNRSTVMRQNGLNGGFNGGSPALNSGFQAPRMRARSSQTKKQTSRSSTNRAFRQP